MAIKANRMSYLQPYQCVSDIGDFFGLGWKTNDGKLLVMAFRYGMSENTIQSIERQSGYPFQYIQLLTTDDDEQLRRVTDPHPQALQFMESVHSATSNALDAHAVDIFNSFSIDEQSFPLLISSWQSTWTIKIEYPSTDYGFFNRYATIVINQHPVEIKPSQWGKAIYRNREYLVVWTYNNQVHTVEWTSDTGRYLQASILGRFDFDGDIGNPDFSVIASVLGAAT